MQILLLTGVLVTLTHVYHASVFNLHENSITYRAYPLKISTAGHQSQFYAKECQVVFCSVGSGSERDWVIWKEIIVIEV